MKCVWVRGGRRRAPHRRRPAGHPPGAGGGRPAPAGQSSWLRAVRERTAACAMKFEDEPVPGYPLPILPGHTSPGPLRARAARRAVRGDDRARPARTPPTRRTSTAAHGCSMARSMRSTPPTAAAPTATCRAWRCARCSPGSATRPIMQISCRDKNRIAIQGDILGGAAMGVCNLLCLTGDGVQAGDHPQATPVFDLDSMSLLETARTLRDEHHFLSGRKITFAPRVLLGAAENPFAQPVEWRARGSRRRSPPARSSSRPSTATTCRCCGRFMHQVEEPGAARQGLHPRRRGTAALRQVGRVDPHSRARRAHPGCGDQAPRRAPATRRPRAAGCASI